MAGSRTLKLSILADVDDLKKKLGTAENEVQGFAGKVEKFGAAAKAAFLAAAAAAGAYAVKLAVDGVQAAIEDEAAQKRLANALKNVTDATDTQIAAIEEQILQISLATGVADDKLRPAFQRLATATGDLTKSQDLLTLALDISAATGKDVETVSNALGKAYEGNTSSLTRLGVGLSAAEIKTLGLEGSIKQLSATFGGAAATQADTFQGRIARLQVAFDEAKETVGTALLPIIEKLLTFITDTAIPKFQEFKESAIDPIITAVKNNEDALRNLWSFAKDFLIPLFGGALMNVIKGVTTAISAIVNVVAAVITAIKNLANQAIAIINTIIAAYNAIPILPNISTIPTIGSSGSSRTGSIPTSNLPFGGASVGGTITGGTTGGNISGGTITGGGIGGVTGGTPNVGAGTIVFPTGGGTAPFTSIAGSTFNPSAARLGEQRDVIINVNAPSVIDEEGFTRAVVLALNNSTNRGTTGAGGLRTQAQIL